VRSQSLRRFPGIRLRESLERTIRTGRVARTSYFTVCYQVGEGPPGVAVLAGRKVGGAVRRNRAKRVLREAFRTNDADLSGIETLVFIASTRAAAARLCDVSQALNEELRRISDRDS
jgi:ribonuclease P protein component